MEAIQVAFKASLPRGFSMIDTTASASICTHAIKVNDELSMRGSSPTMLSSFASRRGCARPPVGNFIKPPSSRKNADDVGMSLRDCSETNCTYLKNWSGFLMPRSPSVRNIKLSALEQLASLHADTLPFGAVAHATQNAPEICVVG